MDGRNPAGLGQQHLEARISTSGTHRPSTPTSPGPTVSVTAKASAPASFPAVDVGSQPGLTQVIVVGGGVSGCACGATLATAGVRVTVINSAMDRVGLPAYGPDIVAGEGGWDRLNEVLNSLPEALRTVWLAASLKPETGEAILNVDRRTVSIETKQALEGICGLEFRQGFVTDVRLVPRCSESREAEGAGAPDGSAIPRLQAEVETVFGEVLRADAVVVAAGLSLGGRSTMGGDSVPGGRYGEPASDGLLRALEALGAPLSTTTLAVGPRVSSDSARRWLTRRDEQRPQEVTEHPVMVGGAVEEALLPIETEGKPEWPEYYPPAPHRMAGLRGDRIVMPRRSPVTDHLGGRGGHHGAEATQVREPLVSPDGGATDETYLAPEGPFARALAACPDADAVPIASRTAVAVSGKVVAGLTLSGRLESSEGPGPIWVVGRSAGATDYIESLASGLRAAADIARVLGATATVAGAPGGQAGRDWGGHHPTAREAGSG